MVGVADLDCAELRQLFRLRELPQLQHVAAVEMHDVLETTVRQTGEPVVVEVQPLQAGQRHEGVVGDAGDTVGPQVTAGGEVVKDGYMRWLSRLCTGR